MSNSRIGRWAQGPVTMSWQSFTPIIVKGIVSHFLLYQYLILGPKTHWWILFTEHQIGNGWELFCPTVLGVISGPLCSSLQLQHSVVQRWHSVVQRWHPAVHRWHSAVKGWHFAVQGCHPVVQRCHLWTTGCHLWTAGVPLLDSRVL